MTEVTKILRAVEEGDAEASRRLLPLVYEELRQMARQRMTQERGDHTLQATALVHEAYVRLVGSAFPAKASRGHFFAAAAEAMRRILIDHARRNRALRRGGGRYRIDTEEDIPEITVPNTTPEELLDLNDALEGLLEVDPGKAELVKLRYFAGLSLGEAAAALGISRATAQRHWTFARAWLHHRITHGGGKSG